MRLLVAAAAVAALSSAADSVSLTAQTIPSSYEYIQTRQGAGPFVGYSKVAKGRFGFGPAGGLQYGARYGLNLSGPMGLELVTGLISGERDVVNPARIEGERIVGTADVLLATIDARLRFTLTGDRTWHGLAPFIVAGGGMAIDASPDQPDDELLEAQDRFDFGNSFFGTLGGGMTLFLTRGLAIRTDGVFSLWKLDTPPGFSDPARGFEAVEESEWASGLHLSIGFEFRF